MEINLSSGEYLFYLCIVEVQQEYSILAVHAYTVKVIVGLLLLYFLKVNIFTFIAVENLFPA
jgi:hypothetical protein